MEIFFDISHVMVKITSTKKVFKHNTPNIHIITLFHCATLHHYLVAMKSLWTKIYALFAIQQLITSGWGIFDPWKIILKKRQMQQI